MTVLHCILHALDLAWHALLWSWAVIGAAILLASIVGLIHDWRDQRAERIDVDQPIDLWPLPTAQEQRRAFVDDVLATYDIALWEIESGWSA